MPGLLFSLLLLPRKTFLDLQEVWSKETAPCPDQIFSITSFLKKEEEKKGILSSVLWHYIVGWFLELRKG